MRKKTTKYEIAYYFASSLLYKVDRNVRMINLDWNDDFSRIKMYCYLNTQPTEKDTELMEDVIALFISYNNYYEIEVDLSIEFSDKTFNELVGENIKYIAFAEFTESEVTMPIIFST